MERDAELRIKGHLYEIEEVNDECIGHQQGFPVAREAYKRTLESVANCVSQAPESMRESEVATCLDEVARYIKNHIQEHHERPNNRKVRREARSIISKAGHAPDSYLNAA